MWVLGVKPRTSARASTVLTVEPSLPPFFFFISYFLNFGGYRVSLVSLDVLDLTL